MKKSEYDVIIVGSGAGGATVAKELSKKGRSILIVERGPLPHTLGTSSSIFKYFDRFGFKAGNFGNYIYRALMCGGTTCVSCGNGMVALKDEFEKIGIDLSEEFKEVSNELNIQPLSDRLIGKGTKLIMDSACALGHEMKPMPKFVDHKLCVSCGNCVLGCRYGAKWTALNFLEESLKNGASLITKTKIESVIIRNNRAEGVLAVGPKGKVEIKADKIILAAGGIGTPAILQRSGVDNAGKKLFVDFFSVVYGKMRNTKIRLDKEPSMAAICDKYYGDKGFILSPFIDTTLAFRIVVPVWAQLRGFQRNNLLGIMVKIKDSDEGSVTEREKIFKKVSQIDNIRLQEGARIAKDVLINIGINRKDILITKPRGAHPGGSAGIGEVVNKNLETKIKNLYVCDASVLPQSPGIPPIVVILALAKKFCKYLIADQSISLSNYE